MEMRKEESNLLREKGEENVFGVECFGERDDE